MNFKDSIEYYENINSCKDYIEIKGNIPILLTAPHTMNQRRNDGTIKLAENYTKGITLYLANKLNLYTLVKTKDTGIDSNSDLNEEFKTRIRELIKEHNISLVLDIHGALKERDFDIELGTINNLSADFATIRELEEAFKEMGFDKISLNEPFKGGGITKEIYGLTNIDIIQIEINGKLRDINDVDKMEKLCFALENFIKQYYNLIK